MSSTTKTVVRGSPAPAGNGDQDAEARRGILQAAFATFVERGYAATSTLEIATRARVSKRELYALVGNKQQMLLACIQERSRGLQIPTDWPAPRDRAALAVALETFGTQLLRQVSDPTVVAMFRLAIAEAIHAPEVARALDAVGRGTRRKALVDLMSSARASRLLDGQPDELADQFAGLLLLSDRMLSLLLDVAGTPSRREPASRARDATAAFLQLHLPPKVRRR